MLHDPRFHNPHEVILKLATIRVFLDRHPPAPDFLIINEFTSNLSGRRVDLAIVNGGVTHGFEIKSARDSVRRLEGQVATFRRNFDRLTLVVDIRHARAVRQVAKSAGAGLWIARADTISEDMKGRRIPVNADALLRCFPDSARPDAHLSLVEIRQSYLKFLAHKYSRNRRPSELAAKQGYMNVAGLGSLSEFKEMRKTALEHANARIEQWAALMTYEFQSSQSSSVSSSADS